MKNKIDLTGIEKLHDLLGSRIYLVGRIQELGSEQLKADTQSIKITPLEAKAIATALEELPKMHEALMALSTDMMDYLQNFDSPKVGLWAKKCNEILQQFETPELPEPQSNLVCKNDQIDRDYGF